MTTKNCLSVAVSAHGVGTQIIIYGFYHLPRVCQTHGTVTILKM